MRLLVCLWMCVVCACGDAPPTEQPADATPPDAFVYPAAPDAMPDAGVPTSPVDQLVEVPLPTAPVVADGCETWPGNPEPRRAQYDVPSILRLGDQVLWLRDGAAWRLDGDRWMLEVQFDDAMWGHIRRVGDQVVAVNAISTHVRASDGTWTTHASVGGDFRGVFRVRDQLYAWSYYYPAEKTRLYRWDATTSTWQYVFGTGYGVVTMAGSDDGLFVVTPGMALLRWNGSALVPFVKPTNAPTWRVLGDGNGRLFAFTERPYVGNLQRLEDDAWVDEGFVSGYSARVDDGVIVIRQRALMDSGWVTLPYEGVVVRTAYADGTAFGYREEPSTYVPVALTAGTWQELPYAAPVESIALEVVDPENAYAVDHEMLLHRTGSTWSRVLLPSTWWARLAISIDGELFVVIRTRTGSDQVLHWDGTSWTSEEFGDHGSVQIAARSPEDVYVVASCWTRRWNGNRWLRLWENGCGPANERIALVGDTQVAVFHPSVGDVSVIESRTKEILGYHELEDESVFGELRGGAVRQAVVLEPDDDLHVYDETAGWTTVAIPGLETVVAIRGTAIDDITFLERDGEQWTLAHWNGSGLERLGVTGPVGTSLSITPGEVHFGGDGELVRRCATPW